jgi:hypothetical protein
MRFGASNLLLMKSTVSFQQQLNAMCPKENSENFKKLVP